MKSKYLSHYIWKAIEAQAGAAANNLPNSVIPKATADEIDTVNEFELKRLRILIQQLEEISPNS